jgi:hypothetical protein
VGSSRSSYRVQAFRKFAGRELRVDILNIKVNDLSSVTGKEGVIWSFILTMTMITIGVLTGSPVIGVILYLVVFLMLGAIDLVYIDPAIAIAEIIIGVLFVWAFRS